MNHPGASGGSSLPRHPGRPRALTASRKIGRATLYRANLENQMVKTLIEHEKQLSLQIAEKEVEKTKTQIAAT